MIQAKLNETDDTTLCDKNLLFILSSVLMRRHKMLKEKTRS